MMRPEFTTASSTPALGLGAEPLVALNVVETRIAQLLSNRVTLLGVVLGYGHVS